jgi:hypothetical protein
MVKTGYLFRISEPHKIKLDKMKIKRRLGQGEYLEFLIDKDYKDNNPQEKIQELNKQIKEQEKLISKLKDDIKIAEKEKEEQDALEEVNKKDYERYISKYAMMWQLGMYEKNVRDTCNRECSRYDKKPSDMLSDIKKMSKDIEVSWEDEQKIKKTEPIYTSYGKS